MTPGRHAIIAHPAAAILVLALIYIVSGQLALMLALPPGYVSAIFPPAGIALAALAVGGTRLVPGVAIGASALVVLQEWAHHGGLSGASILAAGAVATGSAVQAWIGGALVRRWLAPALDSARDVLLFLLLAPLVCVISASCAIPALFGLGMLTSGDLLTNWLIWWAGDTVGVLLAAPLAWILIGTPRPAWRSRRWLLSLPLCLSSAAFIVIYTKVSVWEQEQLMLTFRLKSQQVGDMLQSQFSEHERLMYTVASLFNKRHADSATEFSKLARSYLGNRPELRLMAWAPRVPADERAQFEHWAEGHVGPGFLIRQFNGDNDPIPAATRSEYYPMIFREPLTGNERAHGIDLLSEPQRAAATRRTIASGRPAATAPLTLIHGQGSKRGILLQQAINLTTDIKPGEPAGILVVLLQFEPYLQHALVHVDFPYFLIRLEDRTAAAPEVLIDTLDRPAQAADSRHTLKLGGREYHLTLAPSNLYLKTRHGWQSWAVLSGGLLLTGLLGAFLLLMSGQRARIEQLVAERTRKLQEREARLSAILDNAADAILTVDRAGIIVSVNDAAANLFAYPLHTMSGLPFSRLVQSGEGDQEPQLLERLSWNSHSGIELMGRDARNRSFPLSIAVSLVEVTDETFFVCILRNLTEQHRSQEKIYQLAHHDSLTGLANRFMLNLRLEQLLALARRHQAAIAIMFIDLDHFKKINDTHGHHIGDQLLVETAKRLKELLRDVDTVARLGGDEFIVALANYTTTDDVAAIAQRIISAAAAPYRLADQHLHTGASIGISMFPSDGNDVNTLLRNADAAMYVAKQNGRGNYQFFSFELNAAAHARLQMESDIWLALERKELELYLQPQVDLASGEIVGAEALIRWHHPQLGLIAPDRFIPIAEESDLILRLGEWVLARAMEILAGWQQQRSRPWRLAINLSARQFHSNTLLTGVDQLQQETGVDLRGLEMEITETAAMHDPEQTQELLRQLRLRGIKVAIDDFGTGYSSLSYLKLFAIDRIKIDRSFVKDIEADQNDAVIASATIALAHTLGLQVIAEGVETEAQSAFLRQHQCDEAQGFLFGRPVPIAQFEHFAGAQEAPGAEPSTAPKKHAPL